MSEFDPLGAAMALSQDEQLMLLSWLAKVELEAPARDPKAIFLALAMDTPMADATMQYVEAMAGLQQAMADWMQGKGLARVEDLDKLEADRVWALAQIEASTNLDREVPRG